VVSFLKIKKKKPLHINEVISISSMCLAPVGKDLSLYDALEWLSDMSFGKGGTLTWTQTQTKIFRHT